MLPTHAGERLPLPTRLVSPKPNPEPKPKPKPKPKQVGGFLFRRTGESVPCHEMAGTEANASGTCPLLRACLEAAMGNGTIFAWDAADTPFGTAPDEAAIALWFALVFSCYFTFYISGSVLVYDALGQELTNDYLRRGQLFALKAFLGMLGAQRPSPSP